MTGKCEFSLSELLYDLDFPGQYMRRIKSVSVSIPAVTGPYTNVSCRLVLHGNSYRFDPACDGTSEGYEMEGDDPRFVYNPVGIQSISTSHGKNDRGLFEFSFNDERYVPFEGAGAISRWSLELPADFRQFDYQTIADVILQISYTSCDGGGNLRDGATAYLKANIDALLDKEDMYLLYGNEWNAQLPDELYTLNSASPHTVDFKIQKSQFPAFVVDYCNRNGKKIKIIEIIMLYKEGDTAPGTVALAGSGCSLSDGGFPGFKKASVGSLNDEVDPEYTYTLSFNQGTMENIWMVFSYQLTS